MRAEADDAPGELPSVDPLIASAGAWMVRSALDLRGRPPSPHAAMAMAIAGRACVSVHGTIPTHDEPARNLLRAAMWDEDVSEAIAIARSIYASEGSAWTGLADAFGRLRRWFARPTRGAIVVDVAMAIAADDDPIPMRRDRRWLLPRGEIAVALAG